MDKVEYGWMDKMERVNKWAGLLLLGLFPTLGPHFPYFFLLFKVIEGNNISICTNIKTPRTA
jgi:hypothetical protein